jgi:hypothetical protein
MLCEDAAVAKHSMNMAAGSPFQSLYFTFWNMRGTNYLLSLIICARNFI